MTQATFRDFGHDPRDDLLDREKTVHTLVCEEYKSTFDVADMTDETLDSVARVLHSALWKLDEWDEQKDGPVPILEDDGWREVGAETERRSEK